MDSHTLPCNTHKRTHKQILQSSSPPKRVTITSNAVYMWQFNYANTSTVPIVPCVSNNLICGYITGVHFCPQAVDKRSIMWCFHNPSEFYEYYFMYYMLIIWWYILPIIHKLCYVCTYVHTYVYMYVRMQVCMYISVYMHVCMYIRMYMYINHSLGNRGQPHMCIITFLLTVATCC